MLETSAALPEHIPGARPAPAVSNAVLGTLIFVLCEIMLFGGFISAFMIVRTQALGVWPPPGQPRLPVETTAFNTAALLASGLFLALAHRAYRRGASNTLHFLTVSIALGGFFVIAQGAEWVRLIAEGLTLVSSTHGGFFYTIVGLHGLHAVAAIIALGYVWARLRREDLSPDRFFASEVFWYFVVGLWPILYLRVYL